MKRATIHSIEEHVAERAIEYLQDRDVELKRLKHSLQALEKKFDSSIRYSDKCDVCLVYFANVEEKLECTRHVCQDEKCETKQEVSCGRFGCKSEYICFMCGCALCPYADVCACWECYYTDQDNHACESRLCSKCSKLPEVKKCSFCANEKERIGIECPKHKLLPLGDKWACDYCFNEKNLLL